MKTIKWIVIIVIVILASIRISLVDAKRKKHIFNCNEQYETYRFNGRVSWKEITCKHCN